MKINESTVHAYFSSKFTFRIMSHLFPRMLSEQEGGVFGGGMGNESLLELLSSGVLAPLSPQQLGVSLRETMKGKIYNGGRNFPLYYNVVT